MKKIWAIIGGLYVLICAVSAIWSIHFCNKWFDTEY